MDYDDLLAVLLLLLSTVIMAQESEYEVRTIDQCYGKPIPVACDPGYMVKVNKAFYRQTENCKGGFHSNYCSRDEPSNPACVGNQTCIFTTPWVYLSSECGYSNNFLISYQCVPASSQVDVCSESVVFSLRGYVTSPNYPQKYAASKHCNLQVVVSPGHRIRVFLLDLYLAYYNYDVSKQCVDAVWVADGNERTEYLCSGKQRGLVFTSRANKVVVYFSSEEHQYLNAKGFWLYYEAFVDETDGIAAPSRPHKNSTYEKLRQRELLTQLPVQPTVASTDLHVTPGPTLSEWLLETVSMSNNTTATSTSSSTLMPSSTVPATVVPRHTTPDSHIVVDVSGHKSNISLTTQPQQHNTTDGIDMSILSKHKTSDKVSGNENDSYHQEETSYGLDHTPDWTSGLPWNSAIGRRQHVGIRDNKLDSASIGGIIGGTLGFLAIIIVLVVLGALWKRQKNVTKMSETMCSDDSTSSGEYSDIIFAYGSSTECESPGLSNLTFDYNSPPAPQYPPDMGAGVAMPYIHGVRAPWGGLVPIDEVPEILYAQSKTPVQQLQQGWSSLRGPKVKSKSMDDLYAKISGKAKKKRCNSSVGLIGSRSMEYLPQDYENVIMPHYATLNRRHSHTNDICLAPAFFQSGYQAMPKHPAMSSPSSTPLASPMSPTVVASPFMNPYNNTPLTSFTAPPQAAQYNSPLNAFSSAHSVPYNTPLTAYTGNHGSPLTTSFSHVPHSVSHTATQNTHAYTSAPVTMYSPNNLTTPDYDRHHLATRSHPKETYGIHTPQGNPWTQDYQFNLDPPYERMRIHNQTEDEVAL